MEIKIDKDFKNLMPPLSPEEFKQLEQNLLEEKRCREPIVTWKKSIIDGYNRYSICQQHKIPYKITKMHFKSKEDAILWIAENQLGRRNLSNAVRIDIASQMAEMLRIKAKKNLASKQKVDEPINVQKSIAKAAGVSQQMVHRYIKILGCADPEMVDALRKGELKINTAYNQLFVASKTVRKIDISGGAGDKHGVEEYCRIYGIIDRMEGFYRILGLDGCYRGVEVRDGLERQGVVLGRLLCNLIA